MNLTAIITGIFSGLPYLFHHAAWSVVAGILVVVAFIALLLLLVRGFYPRATFLPGSLVTAGVLGILLCFQFIPICAAFGLKSKLSDMKEWLNTEIIHPEQYVIPQQVDEAESTEIVKQAVDEYPIMGMLFSSGWFKGYDTSNLAEGICDEVNSELNKMIWKLLLISFIETVVGAFIIIRIEGQRMDRRSRQRHSVRAGAGPGGTCRTARPGTRRRR